MLNSQRSLQITTDGSHTITIPSLDVTYHSRHGAITESMHVFIEAGLQYWRQQNDSKKNISIFEMGFGTGLNALLTYMIASNSITVNYTTVEKFPLEKEIFDALNYCEQLNNKNYESDFRQMHDCEWNRPVQINSHFTLEKINASLLELEFEKKFDVVYFDAFDPVTQPELWTAGVFAKLYNAMNIDGVLVTYCSKSDVRRALQQVGFEVSKIPGPPYKREILRALKKGEG